jgi:hypothetical protein
MSSSSRSTPNIYENNNDVKLANGKMTDTRTTNSPQPTPNPKTSSPRPSKPTKCCSCLHLNNLWSLWYGIFGTALQAYTAIKCVKRILGYSLLSWPENLSVPYLELNCSLGLTGAAILLLPVFLVATLFKVLSHISQTSFLQTSLPDRELGQRRVQAGAPVEHLQQRTRLRDPDQSRKLQTLPARRPHRPIRPFGHSFLPARPQAPDGGSPHRSRLPLARYSPKSSLPPSLMVSSRLVVAHRFGLHGVAQRPNGDFEFHDGQQLHQHSFDRAGEEIGDHHTLASDPSALHQQLGGDQYGDQDAERLHRSREPHQLRTQEYR